MADAQVWTVMALLAAALFGIVIEIRRMNEMQKQFGGAQQQFAGVQQRFAEVHAELAELRSELTADIAELRNDLRFHTEHGHRPSA